MRKKEIDLKKLTMEQLEEMLTDVINAREAFPEQSMNRKAVSLDDLYGEIDAEMATRRLHSDKFPWCHREADINGYNNSYITVTIFDACTTKDFEDAIYVSGLSERVMYPEFRETDNCIEFDVHKGDFEEVRALSKRFPESVIFASSDWDDHTFFVCLNGKECDDFTVSWLGGEPKGYDDDGETYYDCDVKVSVKLPDGKVCDCFCGGGMCTEQEKAYYDSFIRGERQKKVGNRLFISTNQLESEDLCEALRKTAMAVGTMNIEVRDASLPKGAYWEVEYNSFADEGVALKDEKGSVLYSWGHDEHGEFVVNDGLWKAPKELKSICEEHGSYFAQLRALVKVLA